MSPYFDVIVQLLIIAIILFILIGFIYIWLYVAKKEKLMKHLMPIQLVKRKRKIQEIIWNPLIKAAEYVAPTAEKYKFMFDFEKDEKILVRAGNPLGLKVESLPWAPFCFRFSYFVHCHHLFIFRYACHLLC
ncbi:hypothetical protein ACA29_23225 [Lederbergia galactosidilytica]|uniref:Uncharacterized protein n=1 Tax=Lederbergia galactosidilytica TaxID=217031 RepID=A0A0Q9XM52_9BACI|nr:hypothetical protein ACA29_23225 [Lederbergia galactosidilytica]